MAVGSGDAGLVRCLVDRLAGRLPHRTGTNGEDVAQDEIVTISRTTLVQISSTSISLVLDATLALLEDLGRGYKYVPNHPPHVLLSENFMLSLVADCCSAHWQSIRAGNGDAGLDGADGHGRPEPLDETLVVRFLDLLRLLLEPIPDGFALPPQTILEDAMPSASNEPVAIGRDGGHPQNAEPFAETNIRRIVEYLTASAWPCCFEYLRKSLYSLRMTSAAAQAAAPQPVAVSDEERLGLAFLRLASFFWVDSQQLGLVIQEICSSFLHLRKLVQNSIALMVPLLITRWVDRQPSEFMQFHNLHKRLDGGADTLFDMALGAVENGRRKAIFYPLLTSLLFLLPDVFEVASNLREAKTGGLSKKVAFLDALRKALRNRNEHAGYCLVSLLRVARHFDAASDAALVSYAMDVQDEVRDAVFRRYPAGVDAPIFEQDMMTAAFVSLAHLNLDSSVDSLIQTCLVPSAPLNFKTAVIQGCRYFAGQNDPAKYEQLFAAAAPFMRDQLKLVAALDVDSLVGGHAVNSRPSDTNAPTILTCDILRFMDVSPSTLFQLDLPHVGGGRHKRMAESGRGRDEDDDDSDDDDDDDDDDDAAADDDDGNEMISRVFEWFLFCVASPNDEIRSLASCVAKRLFAEPKALSRLRARGRLGSLALRREFWRRSSAVMTTLSDRIGAEVDNAELRTLEGYLEARLLLLTSIRELADLSEHMPELASASSKLEMALLVSLCSVELESCQLVTSCIGHFLQECTILEAASDSAKSASTLLRNADVFRELSSRAFRFTGPVAFQKRVRGLLRRLQCPTSGILAAWEAAFEKWLHLSGDVSTTAMETIDEKSLGEWRNYSGFLASLGGICTADQAIILEEPTVSGLRWIDRLQSDNEEPLLGRYLRLSIQLLACPNIRVREASREVLSTEISPSLFQALFKALESELEVLFSGALASAEVGRPQEREIIFAEQASSLLKALIERLDSPSDLGAASSVHLGALTLNFAKFLDGVPEGISPLKVKIKVCQLCEAVTKRKEHLNLRDDVRIRNQLLEFIFGWITDARSARPDIHAGGRQADAARVQKDLDKACLRALADLTFRLPLQPADGQTDAGTSELKSQMFLTYFTRFLSLLNHESQETAASGREEATPVSELAITILSNLLSANIDVGLKHSLNIGYHDNAEIRTAFVKVLYNILIQGTEFSNLTDAAVSEKYDELLELLTKDISLAAAMSAICPSSEVDELAISLLTIFEHRGRSFDLLGALIRQEIEETENEAELLRRNCVATKMLSIYAKWKGAPYLKCTLQKVVERLMLTSKDLDLELDPARIDSSEELQKNALQLRIVAKVFVDDICASSASIPPSFRKICSIISSAVLPRFGEAKYTAVGAFIFLRFFCPAIVAPEVEGLVTTPPSKEMRRGLLLIAKVVQNLANNVLFGAKEPYMFPLNDFLAQNIYNVTAFLREISVAPSPSQLDAPSSSESFDFGSCVALHRFMYDQWDHVRQRLVANERRGYARSPAENSRGRSPILEPLRNLITNLGPPPLAVTWNRPQISANTPPSYSRFQNFMLRNAFRGTESYLTARAVYDGGESKDGLSIICVILRHIDTESIDYDTILYCYLKIASRLWHRPFGLLIDATCYSGQGEAQDELFKKLELLSPTELSRSLSRVYVYNMNSSFRKCFRRLLRVATKNSNSVFNPKNIEYHLIGSLQDLQAHFHLSQLNLPRETISVVTDTRFVFQPITRLSKTKGKIEVVIKVGSQFVQVTTTKKSEVHPGFRLHTTVNDIFRLGEVDEAPTSIQTEDDSAFGLRADNGKIVMFFTSPKKSDVLQTIRGAKAKYAKDIRSHKMAERLIRPQDVPGTLLNLALTNLSSGDHVLRLSSYNLLGALCRAFKFDSASRLMCTRDVAVPLDASAFIVDISKQLARSEPQLTYDFLTEFFVGWESFSDEQKPLSLAYMAPWLPGLRTSVLVAETDAEKGREKIATLFRKLVDIAMSDHSLTYVLDQAVWPAITNDEVLVDIFLEELTKAALNLRLHDDALEALSSVAATIGTVTLRGKVISRLRKALNRSSLRPTKYLPENAVWAEICVLLQFCLALSFDNGIQAQLYLPEIFHVVTMLANTGSADIRVVVHRLLVNSVHAACTCFSLDDVRLNKLRGSLDFLSESRNELFAAMPAFARDGASTSTTHETGPTLAATETLAALLFDLCAVAAPSVDMSNAWRSRWMSLVASTAFQNNPAIQPRAFAVMGCLAREEVDDDLLYQVLVALRNSVGRFGEESGSEMLVSIVTSLSKMMAKLPSASRYGLQLFWLAMSLLRLVPPALFNCTAHFLEAVLANISTTGDIRGEKMVPLLLQGRSQLEEAAGPLDSAYGVRFTPENFHFAVCACLARGLTDTVTRTTAMRVLAAFLVMAGTDMPSSPYMALMLARAAGLEELRDGLWSAGINPSVFDGVSGVRTLQTLGSVKDKDLLLNTTIELVDFQYLEDTVQHRSLQWLDELAVARPAVIMHLREPIFSILDDILLHCQNSSTIEAAHALLRAMSSNPKFSTMVDSSVALADVLDDMGFGGLWRSCSLAGTQEPDRQYLALTEKLIELIII